MRLRLWPIFLLALGLARSIAGFTNDTLIVVSRYYTNDTLDPGDTLAITFQIENNESNPVHGLFLSDQLPSEFVVLETNVSIEGVDLGDYVYEVGYAGEVYQHNTPHRWAFETPPGFSEENPIPAGSSAQIEYLVECSYAGEFVFRNFSWTGAVVGAVDTLWVFGYDDDSLRIVVRSVGVNENPSYQGKMGFSLFASYPNPFKNFTTIGYELPTRTYVTVKAYDTAGRVASVLYRGEQLQGCHYVSWDRGDLPSGVYFIRILAGPHAATKKVIIME